MKQKHLIQRGKQRLSWTSRHSVLALLIVVVLSILLLVFIFLFPKRAL